MSYDGAADSLVYAVPPHWHKFHDEHMEVLRGSVEFTANGQTTVVSAGDPKLVIPRLHVHSIRFLKGKSAVFTEKTDPPGDFKERFFENVMDDGTVTLSAVLRAGYDGDAYMHFPYSFRLLDEAITLVGGAIAKVLFPQKNRGMLAESMAKAKYAASG